VTLTLLDVNDTFTSPGEGSASHVIRPNSGEVYAVSVRASITNAGQSGDGLYLYARTDTGADETLDSDTDETANVFADPVVASNDCYIVIKAEGWKIQ